MRIRRRKKTKIVPTRSGGIAFFLSLAFLLLLSCLNSMLLPSLWDSNAVTHITRFLAGITIGGWFATAFVRGRRSVLIHEFKHAIISNLVGNKWKKLKVNRDSGYFRYAYTKDTAEYNAFIALAPYWLPLFTVPALLIGLPVWYAQRDLLVVVVGAGYGLDLVMNIRDISPIQTDITYIRGGYSVGLLYIIAMNVTLCTILLAWVMQGIAGLSFLLYGLWNFVIHLTAYYRGL